MGNCRIIENQIGFSVLFLWVLASMPACCHALSIHQIGRESNSPLPWRVAVKRNILMRWGESWCEDTLTASSYIMMENRAELFLPVLRQQASHFGRSAQVRLFNTDRVLPTLLGSILFTCQAEPFYSPPFFFMETEEEKAKVHHCYSAHRAIQGCAQIFIAWASHAGV